MSDTQAARYDQQVASGLEVLGQAVGKLEKAENDRNRPGIRRCLGDVTNMIASIRKNLKRFDLAISNVNGFEIEGYRKKLALYTHKIELAEKQCKAVRAGLERDELFGASKDIESSFGARATTSRTQDEDRELLQETMQSLDRSSAFLNESKQILGETEDIGNNVLTNLDSQHESLLRAHNKVDRTNVNVVEARSALRRMSRRACYNKLVLWVIIILLVVLNVLLLYFKFIKRH